MSGLGGLLPGGVWSGGVSGLGGVWSGGVCSRGSALGRSHPGGGGGSGLGGLVWGGLLLGGLLWGVSAPGVVCSRERVGVCSGGMASQHALRQTPSPPPVNRMNDRQV